MLDTFAHRLASQQQHASSRCFVSTELETSTTEHYNTTTNTTQYTHSIPALGNPSELRDAASDCHVRGMGLPVCLEGVALLAKTAPDCDAATLANAADVPVRGPEAL
jgi:hypothetical protein